MEIEVGRPSLLGLECLGLRGGPNTHFGFCKMLPTSSQKCGALPTHMAPCPPCCLTHSLCVPQVTKVYAQSCVERTPQKSTSTLSAQQGCRCLPTIKAQTLAQTTMHLLQPSSNNRPSSSSMLSPRRACSPASTQACAGIKRTSAGRRPSTAVASA